MKKSVFISLNEKRNASYKSICFLVMIYFLLTINLLAQVPDTLWTKTYGGTEDDDGMAVQQTSDGGFIVAGCTNSFGAGLEDVWLIKTDANGDTLWTRTYGGAHRDLCESCKQTSDGGYILGGRTYSFGAGRYDVYLVKTDSLGDTLWTRTYGSPNNEFGHEVQQTSDGGYIVVGVELGVTNFGDIYLVKTDANGDTIWTRTYGEPDCSDHGYAVQQTYDGGYIITGFTIFGNDYLYLVKTDAIGDTIWTSRFAGGPGSDIGFSVQQTSDSGYIVTGCIGQNYDDVWLIKTDSNGDSMWTKTFGGSGRDIGRCVQLTSDGGYIITGYTESFGSGSYDVWFLKTDANGDTLWTKTYGGILFDGGVSGQQTSDYGYIIAGYTRSFGAGSLDVWLIKTEPDIGIEEQETHSFGDIKIMETIVRDKIRVLLPSNLHEEIVFSLFNVLGQKLKYIPPKTYQQSKVEISIKDLPYGIYFLQIRTQTQTKTEKLVILR